MVIQLPEQVKEVMEKLELAGHSAYVVGGCVRDALLGKQPHDWDICTSALPEESMRCFSGRQVIETGLQHGTVTVIVAHTPYEITTFRTEGTYADSRHPDSVTFVHSLAEDLSRRDFTINAMAYHPLKGLTDLFQGEQDLRLGKIRCVGDPAARFREDALRILRALRFASVLDFEMEEVTAQAVHVHKGLLRRIAWERVQSELTKLLCGAGAQRILTQFADVLFVFLPELASMAGFAQNHPYHVYDVWEHTVKSICAVAPDPILRLTMLLHDAAKPSCYTEDETGKGQFHQHPARGAELAGSILRRLRYDNDTVHTVKTLVACHDITLFASPKLVKRWLNKLGIGCFRMLLQVKRADLAAQNPAYREERIKLLEDIGLLTDQIEAQRQCFCLKDLAVSGRDLLCAGIPQGRQIGEILHCLVDMVIDERIKNDKDCLLKEAKLQYRYGVDAQEALRSGSDSQ